jgi:LPXTG-site transpeptidase (sortase) family protein
VTAVTVTSTVGTSTFTTTITPPIGGPAPYTVVVTFNGTLGASEVVTIRITTVVNSLGAPPVSNSASLTTSALTDNILNNFALAPLTLVVSQSASSLPATGFEPGKITSLLQPPKDKTYKATDLWLEIPGLNITRMDIVGVPLTNKTWDVTWLDKNAGWLNGTSFPTWEGNSVITGHVYLSNGKAGPFVDLGKLKYGDKVLVHAFGSVYVYEIRENKTVKPDDKSAFKHEEKSWITLITCKSFNESTKTYSNRIVVRAVLLRIEEDSIK